MSDLKDLLHGAGEAKRQLFASEDFAGGYGHTVVGRVKRRRAVSATAMGGGTALAVGALAVGASHVPWGSFAMGSSPGSSPSVACTTSTPDAGATAAADVPVPATFVAMEMATGDVAFVGWPLPGGKSTVWGPDGETLALADTAEASIYKFPSGARIKLMDQFQGSGVASLDPAAVRITTVDGYLKSAAASAPPRPIVTCVTTTPTPSASPSADPSSLSAPTPNPTGNIVAGDTPFQCGYVFASDESGTDALRVYGAPTTDSAIHKVFEQWYGNQAPTTEVGDTGAIAYHASLGSFLGTASVNTLDPASHESVQTSKNYDIPSLGLTFVAVRDAVVVGTVVPGGAGQTPGVVVDSDGLPNPLEAFLWDLDAFTPCGTTSIDGAEIYAVAGFGQDGDIAYSWKNVSE